MQICPKCKKSIRYIATGYDTSILCDDEKTVVYTESGRRVAGYKPHQCEAENGSGENNKKNG